MPKYNEYSSAVKPTQFPFTFWVLYGKKNVKFGKEFDGSKGTTSATESRISYQGSGQFYLW